MSDLIERLKLARRMVAGQHDMATIDEAITALSPTLPDEDYQAVKQKASELQEELNAEIKISNERWDRIEQLEDMPIKIQVGTDGQIWIDFDAGDGRQAQLNLNNIVLAKPKKGINRGIMLDAIRAALAERNE